MPTEIACWASNLDVTGDRGWSITIVSSMAVTKESNPGIKNYITPGGFERLRDELRFLAKERPAVTRLVAWPASNGHRSENAD